MKIEPTVKRSRVFFEARDLIVLLALCFILYFWKLGTLPFYDRGESREGLVVWEMFKTGNWILPIVNGEYIPFKPPLFHWFGVLVGMLLGHVDEFVARFPSALFGTLGVLMTYHVGRRWWNRQAGLVAAVVLATSFDWWQSATITQVDMTLAFFISSALMLFYFIYREEQSRTARSLALALLLALGTLAKGPLGVAVPCFVILVFLCIQREVVFVKKLPLLAGTAIFLLVAGSWYGLAFLQGGEDFFRRQIIDETLRTGVGSYGHHQPFYYFVPVLFYNMLPWSFFFPGLAVFLYRERHRLADRHLLYPLVWVGAVFFFFSAALGKRGVYILPLYPAVALLFGAWWSAMEEGIAGRAEVSRWLGFFYAVSGVIATASVSLYFISELMLGQPPLRGVPKKLATVFSALTAAEGRSLIFAGLVLLTACLLWLARLSWTRRWGRVFAVLTVIALVQAFFMKGAYLPYVAAQRTVKPFMSRVMRLVGSAQPLLFYRAFDYGTVFYSHRHIPAYADKFSDLKPPYFLLTWEENVKRLSATNHFKILDMSEGRGPAGRHRLVLLEPEQAWPIIDPKGYGRSRAENDDLGSGE
jgi:4-amino-4-deoxy-L-arabinose transferase-like glycosyltransferase